MYIPVYGYVFCMYCNCSKKSQQLEHYCVLDMKFMCLIDRCGFVLYLSLVVVKECNVFLDCQQVY